MIQTISAKDNPKLKQLRSVLEQASARKKLAQTVLEGAHLLESYLQQQQQPLAVFTTEQGFHHHENQTALAQLDCPIYLLPEHLYQQLSTLKHSTPLMASIALPSPPATWQRRQDCLILDRIQDPGNVGTLLRTAGATGVRQIITTEGTASIWSPRVLRAAMGAHFSLTIFESVDYSHILSGFDIPLFATSSHRPQSIYQLDLRQPCVWILGNEGQGVHSSLLQQAQAVTIPQPGGQESLNVAIAGAVCLFEMTRQRMAN